METRNYQVQRVENKNNFRRIELHIRKLPFVELVKCDKEKGKIYLELKETPAGFENIILKIINTYEKKAVISENTSEESYRRVLFLKGLDCAGCAANIEKEAKNAFGYEKIAVDFATSRFIIETKDKNLIDNIIDRVSRITAGVDPRIEVMELKQGQKVYQEESEKEDYRGFTLFLIGIGFLALAEVLHYLFRNAYDQKTALYPLFLLPYLISFGLVGYKVIYRSFRNIFSGQFFDENFLMTIASIGAFFIRSNEEAVFILVFYQIGEFLQSKAVNHSRRSIRELLSIDSKVANIKINGEITPVEVDSVLVGDMIVVKTGEMIPLDGIITEGKTYLDTKAITGESKYSGAKAGDTVLAGSINMGGLVEVKVIRLHRESTVSKILDLVENANSTKSKTENFITKFARYYTPIVVVLAVLVAITVPFVTTGFKPTSADFNTSIHSALVFLVISCPCALVISIPLGFFGGIGSASKRGILVKGSNYLEALHQVETVVFDKTGTLTKGEFGITEVECVAANTKPDELKQLIVYAEYYSTHPIGISIVEKFGKDNVFKEVIEDFAEFSGRGVRAVINGDKVLVGNARLLQENKIDFAPVAKAGVVIYVVRNKSYLGYAVIGDQIRDEASSVIRRLRKQGVNKIAILTGDNKIIGEHVANSLDVDMVYADLLPDQKVDKFNEIMALSHKKRGKTIYVGDGINDAPVISRSDVGIAMGATGSDAAIALADVVIMSDNLEKINEAIDISRFTRKVVSQNIVFALSVKLIILMIGLMGKAIAWEAIFADVGVSLIAILNASRIIRKFDDKQDNKVDG